MLAIVILAGGQSKRFGTNKLIYKINGEAMIKRVFNAASKITKNIYLSVKDKEQVDTLLHVCEGFRDVIFDSYREVDGPINGIITSLNTISWEEIVTIPGDMPFIDSASLSKFIEICRVLDAESGSVYWPSGWVNVLLQYHRRREVTKYTSLSVTRGVMSRPSDILRASGHACYIPIHHLTKDYRTFTNVNTPEDLSQTDIMIVEPDSKIKHIKRDITENFLRGTTLLKSDPSISAEYYLSEGEKYQEEELYTLALHAYKDAKICYEKLNKISESKKLDTKIMDVKSRLSRHK